MCIDRVAAGAETLVSGLCAGQTCALNNILYREVKLSNINKAKISFNPPVKMAMGRRVASL